MTTHAPARTTDRPIPSPFTGAGKLWRATFLSHILNPWNMAFALLLPLFMYAMFGMTEAARTTQTGRGNVAAAMVVMMTTYGVILVGGSLGATLSGVTFPVPYMYAPIYYLSFLFPVRHFVEINQNILYGDYGFAYTWQNASCLFVFMLAALLMLPHLKRAILSRKYENIE